MTTAVKRNSTTAAARYGSKPTPRVKLTKRQIAIQHPDVETGERLLAEALGAVDQDALHGILKQLTKASVTLGKPDGDNLAFMISMMKSIAPRDSLEAMLTAQMASVHVATMRFACRLAIAEGAPVQEGISRILTRLARTFSTQMEVLNRHRGNGERQITVQNLSVQDGGSAIVGNVTQQAHLTVADTDMPAHKGQHEHDRAMISNGGAA